MFYDSGLSLLCIYSLGFSKELGAMACAFFNPCVATGAKNVCYAPATSSSPLKLVCMKQPMDEIRKMSDGAIEEALEGVRAKLLAMRSLKEGERLHKPRTYRRLQIRFSRLMAVKRERDLERGIRPLESRTLRRAFRRSLLLDLDVENPEEQSQQGSLEGTYFDQ